MKTEEKKLMGGKKGKRVKRTEKENRIERKRKRKT